MSDQQKLLPCPFCGGAPKLEQTRDTGPGIWLQPKPWPAQKMVCSIRCCNTFVYRSTNVIRGDEDKARAWAFELASGDWNRRAPHDRPIAMGAGGQEAAREQPADEQDKRDAERYRAIRSMLNGGPAAEALLEDALRTVFPVDEERAPTPEELDALVDAIGAMQAQRKDGA